MFYNAPVMSAPNASSPSHGVGPMAASGAPPETVGDVGPPAQTGATRTWGTKSFRITLGVFLGALLVRLVYLAESAKNPTFAVPIVDAEVYDGLARALVQGKGMADAFFWQPFFYPFFLSLVYFSSGPSILCAKIVQVVLGAATCALTYRLGERVFDRRIGIVAALMTALYGPLIFLEAELVAAGWAAFWSVALVLLFLKAREEQAPRACFWLGLCGALSILTTPTFLPFFLTSCIWLVVVFCRGASRRRALGRGVPTLLGGLLLVVVPIARLNSLVTGHFGFLPSANGINLYIGNNPDYCQTLTTRPGTDWTRLTQLPQRHGVKNDTWEGQKFFIRQVWEFARTQPLSLAKGLGRKAVEFVTSREIPRNVDIYLFAQWSRLSGWLTWKVGGFGFPFGVLLPLVGVGLACHGRRLPGPLILFLIFYPLAVIVVFVTSRYRAPIVPLATIPAAAGVGALLGMLRGRHWGRLTAAGVGVTGLVLVSSLPGPFCEEELNYEAELYFCLGTVTAGQGRAGEAMAHYEHALRIRPDFADAHHNWGAALNEQGKLDEAVRHYQEALRLDPNRHDTYVNLAFVRDQQGKTEEARGYLQKALQLEPNDSMAHNNLGFMLLKQGRLGGADGAIEHLNEALRINPGYAKARQNLNTALARKEEYEKAVDHYGEVLRLQPNAPGGYTNLVSALVSLGRIDEAVERCAEALTANSQNADALYALAFALESGDRLQEALEAYEALLQFDPNHAQARQRLEAVQARLNRASTSSGIIHPPG